MKIAINTRLLLKGKLEGIGWHNYEICRRLVERHPDDEFLFLFDRPYAPEFVFADNVTPLVIPPPARHPLLWQLWFERSVPRVLGRLQPDVFLSPDGYCSLRSRVPTVMVTHDIAHLHYPNQIPFLVRRFYEQQVPRYLQRADRVVTVSTFVKNDIVHHYQVNPDKIEVAHNGGREAFFPINEAEKQQIRDQYADGDAYFFYLGALHPRKNIIRLIRAFDLFRERTAAPVKLLIGGRLAWHTAALKRTYQRARHKSDIHLLGYLPDQEIRRIMGAATALTYVSLFEGFGLPLLEAMHCETPVITSNLSSMPEVAGDAALLVDPKSETSIAEAMEELYAQPDLRTDLIQEGRRQREKFSWDKKAESCRKSPCGKLLDIFSCHQYIARQ